MPNYHARNHMKKKHVIHRMVNKTIFDSECGCWLFIGSQKDRGYGQIKVDTYGRPEEVHKVAAYFFLGYRGYTQVNHKRECLNKNCWNPDHLYVGSQSQNMRDMMAMGTGKNQFVKGR